MISIGNSLPSLRRADELDAGADLLGQGILGRAQVVGDQPLREALRDDVRDLLAEQLVAAVAELLLRLEVEQDDLAGLVDHHHRIRGGLEQAAVFRPRILGHLAGLNVAARATSVLDRRSVSRRAVRSKPSPDAAHEAVLVLECCNVLRTTSAETVAPAPGRGQLLDLAACLVETFEIGSSGRTVHRAHRQRVPRAWSAS